MSVYSAKHIVNSGKLITDILAVISVATPYALCKDQSSDLRPDSLPVTCVVTPHFGETDTVAIQRCIDSKAPEVVIPFIARPWIVEPLRLRDGLMLRLEPGVRLEAKPGSFTKNTDSMLIGHEVHNVSILGYGATIRMRKADYVKFGYQPGQWRHGIDLRGSTNINIEGLAITHTGGDGVYIGPTWDDRRIPCRNVTVRNCTMDRNFRQGISIVSGVNVTIANCVFSRTRGTNPQAGIDLEPAHFNDKLSDIHIHNCSSIGNVGSGFIVSLTRQTSRSSAISVLFENCLARGSQSHLVQTSIGLSPPRGTVLFRNCTFEDSPKAGLRAIWKSAPKQFLLHFENCKWSGVAARYDRAPFALDLAFVDRFSIAGGIRFTNSTVFDHRSRSVLDVVGASRSDIKGKLQVVTPLHAKDKLRPTGSTTELSIEYVESASLLGQGKIGAAPQIRRDE